MAEEVVLEFPGRRFGGRVEGIRRVTIFRFEQGRIVEIQDYLDTELITATWPA